MRANRRRKASSLEKNIHAILKEEGISFMKEKTVGRCHADICIGNTLLELNGCWWHGCARCFPKPTKTQREAMSKDARRYYFFKKLGFNVEIIWECELKNDPAGVRKRLKGMK
jgi:G:T-mismatch repair DNA endonuclease (very short patch repair protein)